jgi:hypothetical protein
MGYVEKSPGVKSRRKARADWLCLKPGTHEGYVSWERFEAIRTMVSNNNVPTAHHVRPSMVRALLAGLIRCRRCGRKLTPAIPAQHHIPRYSCGAAVNTAEPRCIAFGGLRVDDAIERQFSVLSDPVLLLLRWLRRTSQ